MLRSWVKLFALAAIPAAAVCIVAVAIWLLAAPGQFSRTPDNTLFFAGWVEWLLTLCTFACIIWAAIPGPPAAFPWYTPSTSLRQVFLGYAILADMAGLILLILGVGGHFIGWEEWLHLYVLFAAWLAFFTCVPWALQRWGGGVSVGLPALLAFMLAAAPIAWMPVVRAAAHWGSAEASSPWQGRLVQAMAGSCPTLAIIQSLRPSVLIDWPVLPRMYALSGLGQDVAISLLPWWVNVVAYTVAGVIVGIAGFLWRPRNA